MTGVPQISKKQDQILKVSQLMDVMAPEKIAASLGITVRRAETIKKEILRNRITTFKDKDYNELVENSYHSYSRLKEEGWKLFHSSGDPKEKAMALEKIRQAQSAEDQLMKLAGIYKEVSVQITVEQMLENPKFIQYQDAVLDFLAVKGVEPDEFFVFLERREKGDMGITITDIPISRSSDRANPLGVGESKSAIYEQHRKERRQNRESRKRTNLLGSGKKLRDQDPEKMGIKEYNFLEARDLLGSITPKEKERLEQLKKEMYPEE